MGQRHKPGGARESADHQAMRDQEVLRANRELSAYFKGRRTEREARAALKIIKAFVREREHLDTKGRPPLPGAGATKLPKTKLSKNLTKRDAMSEGGERLRRKRRRKPHEKVSASGVAPMEAQMNSQPPQSGPVAPASE